MNLQAALNLLRDGAPISSPAMGEALGVHASTVARLMRTLELAGLVEEYVGEAESTVGRPPKVWQLRPSAGFALGLALHPLTLRGVLTDLTGRIVARRVFSYDPPLSTQGLLEATRELVSSVVGDLSPERILGLGVAVSGVVDPEAGVVRLSGGLFTEDGHFATDYPLRSELQRLFPWPIHVANDANVGALATLQHLVRQEGMSSDISLLYIMAVESLWGFGAGMIIQGRLYTGAHGASGELLHPSLLARVPQWGDTPRHALAGETEAVNRALDELAPWLEHFTALALTMDADRVVLGGALPALGEPLLYRMKELIMATPGYGQHLADLPASGILLDPLRPDTIAIGAAELVLDRLFPEPALGETGLLVQMALSAR